MEFDIGLVPGVVLGSFLAALSGRELKLEGFKDGHSKRRYIVGAICMGFGGCAVGAGLTNYWVDRPQKLEEKAVLLA